MASVKRILQTKMGQRISFTQALDIHIHKKHYIQMLGYHQLQTVVDTLYTQFIVNTYTKNQYTVGPHLSKPPEHRCVITQDFP